VVSTSLLANGLWSVGCYLQACLCAAEFQPRVERYRRSALLETFRCSDGRWFMLSMVNQTREWPLLVLSLALVFAVCIPLKQWLATQPAEGTVWSGRIERAGRLLLGPEQIASFCCFTWGGFILLSRYLESRRHCVHGRQIDAEGCHGSIFGAARRVAPHVESFERCARCAKSRIRHWPR